MDTNIEEALKQYDYPEKVEKIWNECLPEIHQYGVYNRAVNILATCRKVDKLEVKLSRFLSKCEMGRAR